MKHILSSYADSAPPLAEAPSKEYNEAMKAWCDEFMRLHTELWAAMAEVLSAAIQLDLETPSWCRSQPESQRLSNAIDTVLDALPLSGTRAFDKKQGG